MSLLNELNRRNVIRVPLAEVRPPGLGADMYALLEIDPDYVPALEWIPRFALPSTPQPLSHFASDAGYGLPARACLPGTARDRLTHASATWRSAAEACSTTA